MKNYTKLKEIFSQAAQLNYLQRILSWEEMIFMPEGASAARAQALATLKETHHKIICAPKIKKLITAAKEETLSSSFDQKNLTWFEKIYQTNQIIPAKLQAKSTRANLLALQAWRKYRPENNWKSFYPKLNAAFKLIKEIAERKSNAMGLSSYDVLLDSYSPGLKQTTLDPIFSALKPAILDLRKKIIQKEQQQNFIKPNLNYPVEKQKKLMHAIMQKMGFNFITGRLDGCNNSFCDGIATDLRVTASYHEDNFLETLFAVLHETGHALYEQGMPADWLFQPVGKPQCMLTHESQSLLFENEVSRSQALFEGLVALIAELSGDILDAKELFTYSTRLKDTLIRVDADEVNYPLHIAMRFEIEKALFNDEIKISDLPAIWREKTLAYFNIDIGNNYKNGVMQDIHWPFGYYGYFPAYICGQLMAAQLFHYFSVEHPQFSIELKALDFKSLHTWLQNNVYKHAATKNSNELLYACVKESLNAKYFINRIEKQYLRATI